MLQFLFMYLNFEKKIIAKRIRSHLESNDHCIVIDKIIQNNTKATHMVRGWCLHLTRFKKCGDMISLYTFGSHLLV